MLFYLKEAKTVTFIARWPSCSKCVRMLQLPQLREEKGLFQEDIAKYLKIARSTYAGYELGKSEPKIETFKMLTKYYGCSIDYLIGATDKKIQIVIIL